MGGAGGSPPRLDGLDASAAREEIDSGARLGGWKFALRLAVSVALLAILIYNVPDLGGAIPDGHLRATFSWLALALATSIVGIVLSAWRWQRVLIARSAPVGLARLSSHYFAGQFVGNVLPSTIGGDVLRVARGSRSTGSAEVAFSSVVLERLTGFVALPFLVLVGFALRPSLLDHDRAWLALLIAGTTFGALVVIIVLAAHPRVAGRFREHQNWMRFIGAVHVGIDDLRRAPRLAASVMGASLVYQVSVIVSVGFIARALELDLPIAALVAFVPAVAMVQVLPISVSGLGVREGMLVVFLVPLGVTSGQAVAVGLLWYASMLGTSMLGAPAFAIGHRHTRDDRAPSHRHGAEPR